MGRFEVPPNLKEQIRTLFHNRCAACAKEGRLAADVAHLYEDASTSPPRKDSLIVLCSTCNQGEERSHSRSKPSLSELFDKREVTALAQRLYREGRYINAYASHRLAAYLQERQGSYSKAVECLVEAVSDLRPIRHGDLLASALLEVERLCLGHEVGLVPRWLCVDRLALVLYDYRRWEESAEVQYAARQLRDRVKVDVRYPEDLTFDQANSYRREVLIKASTRTLGRGETLTKVLARLEDDAQEFERYGKLDAYATNLDVASKLALEIGGKVDAAHSYSERALEKVDKITHKWVLQEHYWREAEYYLFKKDHKRKFESVVEALGVFLNHPVVLEPTLGAAGPVPHDPITEIERYQVRMDELRERGVAPSRNPLAEQPLLLSRERIGELIGSLSRG